MNNVVDVLQQQGMDTTSLTSLRDDIYYLTVPGSEALSCWHALRASARQTNFWPVIVGGDELDVELVLEELEYESDESPQEIVQAGLAIDPISWLRARVERDPDY